MDDAWAAARGAARSRLHRRLLPRLPGVPRRRRVGRRPDHRLRGRDRSGARDCLRRAARAPGRRVRPGRRPRSRARGDGSRRRQGHGRSCCGGSARLGRDSRPQRAGRGRPRRLLGLSARSRGGCRVRAARRARERGVALVDGRSVACGRLGCRRHRCLPPLLRGRGSRTGRRRQRARRAVRDRGRPRRAPGRGAAAAPPAARRRSGDRRGQRDRHRGLQAPQRASQPPSTASVAPVT